VRLACLILRTLADTREQHAVHRARLVTIVLMYIQTSKLILRGGFAVVFSLLPYWFVGICYLLLPYFVSAIYGEDGIGRL
jgi:hypothetical protein